jgi:hydroxymethylpyrimidine pyrophosphatase-like HAD family hydrolase
MGNNLKQENYEMNIELIGDNLEIFKESISKAKAINNIQKFWKINYNKYQTIESQINSYFNKLQGIKKGHDKTIDLK